LATIGVGKCPESTESTVRNSKVYVPPSEPISPGVLEPVYDKLSKFATTLSEALEKKIQLVPTDSD
jgi:hypothetical protein